MITLKPVELEWINGPEDDPEDQCAHAKVDFKINDTVFISPADESWTVSATALYLLRTLENDSDSESTVAERNSIFACCGINPWIAEEKFDVMIIGCNAGIDVNVVHSGDKVTIQRSDGKKEIIQFEEWRNSVFNFATAIKSYYSNSLPKSKIEDEFDRNGWARFWDEFNSRLNRSAK